MKKEETRETRMFSEETLAQTQAQEEEWQRSVEGQEAAAAEAATYSGIKLKPVYSPSDIAETSCEDIPFPGLYPYTRGPNALGYRAEPWIIRQLFGFGSAADSRNRWEFLRSLGGISRVGESEAEELLALAAIQVDLPTQRGYDPDSPEARGRVGGVGVSISTIEDMEFFFGDIPLEKALVCFVSHNASMVVNALYVAYAETRGYPPSSLLMQGHNTLYHCCGGDVIGFPPQFALKLMTEHIHYFVKHIPRAIHTSLNAHDAGEVGGTVVQQSALPLALAIELTEECIKVGLEPDDVAPGFVNHDWGGIDLFEEVARIRAKRRLWARTFKERFGCKRPEALRYRSQVQTAGSLTTAQEPLNNVVRNTIKSLAAILAGVHALSVCSYDEALCIPTKEAAQIAVRTHQILYHETSLPYVVDPLGGSYYMEWLTNRIEKDAIELLDEMERQGGFFKCWETGLIRGKLEMAANERQRKIDRGEVVIVGQNKYCMPDEEQRDIPVFPSSDPRAEEELIACLKRYREQRDQERVELALSKVRAAAEEIAHGWPQSCGLLMPAMIDAFRNQATLGEVHSILRQVFGYAYIGV